MKYKLVVPLERVGLMFILSGLIAMALETYYLTYLGGLLVIQGLLIEILAFIIYYGEKIYNNEVKK